MSRDLSIEWSRLERAVLVEAGWEHFVARRFFEAHEHWEVAWLATAEGPLREGLRGLVQWAAAAHHLRRAQAGGVVTGVEPEVQAAATVLERAAERLGRLDVQAALTADGEGLLGHIAPPTADLEALSAVLATPGALTKALVLAEPRPGLGAGALLLAAGRGRRAGGPKAIKVRDGQVLWRWQVDQLLGQGCEAVAAVLHPSAWLEPPDAERHAHSVDARRVAAVPGSPGAPQFASLQRALASLPGRAAGMPVLVLPIDCPCPPRRVAVALLAATLEARLRRQPWQAARPCIAQGNGLPRRTGHPVLLAPGWLADLQAADPAATRLDALLAGLEPAHICDVQVYDPGVLANFNRNGVDA